MAARRCLHCGEQVQPGEPHDCWTTTEAALTAVLDDDLRDAWERLRETAASLGEQRIYASHHSIMFARHSCYAFVRPKPRYVELVLFLAREVRSPLVHRVTRASSVKLAHVVRLVHRDQVEPPVTDWLREAWTLNGELGPRGRGTADAGASQRPAGRKPRRPAARTRMPQ